MEPLKAKAVECLVLVTTAALLSDLLFFFKQTFSVRASLLPGVMQLLNIYLQELVLWQIWAGGCGFYPPSPGKSTL